MKWNLFKRMDKLENFVCDKYAGKITSLQIQVMRLEEKLLQQAEILERLDKKNIYELMEKSNKEEEKYYKKHKRTYQSHDWEGA